MNIEGSIKCVYAANKILYGARLQVTDMELSEDDIELLTQCDPEFERCER